MQNFKLLLVTVMWLFSNPCWSQEVILNDHSNRFLINKKSNKPRLDVIVQSFTDYEKNVISKEAVLDTVTKPWFEKVTENEYNVKAGRMGEKLTFVIRDFEKLEDGYGSSFDVGNISSSNDLQNQFQSYLLHGEKCAATQNVPFGTNKVTIKLTDKTQKVLYQLNVTYFYPKPELVYIDVKPYASASKSDSIKYKAFIKNYNQKFTKYSGQYAVPDQIRVAEIDLYFGFKPSYYDGKVSITSVLTNLNGMWRNSDKGIYQFIHLYYPDESQWNWLKSGSYKLSYSYVRNSNSQGQYVFEIRHKWFAELMHFANEVAMLLIVVIFAKPWILFILFGPILFANWGNRIKKLRDEAKKNNFELQSIQAQLNPHFVFNALGSIQGLINKNEIEKANTYLTDFGKLLRNSLTNNGKETVPLSTELHTLENYIKLEQLRFNFHYKIDVDENIETAHVEIPSLLIQPIVENAIKHGISGLGENGVLIISFKKILDNLLIEIQDNGKGFDVGQPSNGQGIKLTQERIKLLNKQKNEILLDIQSSSENGSRVNITLKHVL